ncbi:MAG: hypothetical protein AAGE98_17850 [Actinomycetota bacterium]
MSAGRWRFTLGAMKHFLRPLTLLLALTLVAAACGDDDETTDTAAAEATEDTATPTGSDGDTEHDGDGHDGEHDHDGDHDHEGEHDSEHDEKSDDSGDDIEGSADATVAALIVRSVTGELDTFVETRDAYVADLEAQPGIVHDREFLPFLSFLTFSEPEPPVYIGFTSGTSLPEFGAAADAVAPELQGAYFPTFGIEVFGILAPLDPTTAVDISAIATEPGQVLEIAWRDLSSYDGFDQAAYESARDAYLAELASMDGFVEEYQWVSADGGTLAVGMTVYESAEAFQTIATDADFNASDVYGAFVGGYPIAGGYASTVVK